MDELRDAINAVVERWHRYTFHEVQYHHLAQALHHLEEAEKAVHEADKEDAISNGR